MGQSGQQFFPDGVTVTWQMELKQKPLSVCAHIKLSALPNPSQHLSLSLGDSVTLKVWY